MPPSTTAPPPPCAEGRQPLALPDKVGEVSFSWWVQGLMPNASVADIDREDAVVRVIFGFEGDADKLPLRTRMTFELAQAP